MRDSHLWLDPVPVEEAEKSVYSFPRTLSPELLTIIAYAIPRLHIYGTKKATISCKGYSPDSLIKNLVGVFGGSFSHDENNIYIEDRALCLFLFNLVGSRFDSRRSIPQFVFSLPEKEKKDFLISIISAASAGDSEDVRMFLFSSKVLDGLLKLLSEFGVVPEKNLHSDEIYSLIFKREMLNKIGFPEKYPECDYNRLTSLAGYGS